MVVRIGGHRPSVVEVTTEPLPPHQHDEFRADPPDLQQPRAEAGGAASRGRRQFGVALGFHRLDLRQQPCQPVRLAPDLHPQMPREVPPVPGAQLFQPLATSAPQRFTSAHALRNPKPLDAVDMGYTLARQGLAPRSAPARATGPRPLEGQRRAPAPRPRSCRSWRACADAKSRSKPDRHRGGRSQARHSHESRLIVTSGHSETTPPDGPDLTAGVMMGGKACSMAVACAGGCLSNPPCPSAGGGPPPMKS